MDDNIIKQIINFRDKRNWAQFHNEKDLAISIMVEASELLENFQWKSPEEAVSKRKDLIKEELADVLIYCVLMADRMNLDIGQIIEEKLSNNEMKYPVEKAFGSSKKYNEQ